MAVRAAAVSGRLPPLFHHSQFPVVTGLCVGSRKLNFPPKRLRLFARYSQAQDRFSSRLQGLANLFHIETKMMTMGMEGSALQLISKRSIENLPKLVEDIVQTSINTGPRGALRAAQGIQAVIRVGGEWLADVSQFIASAPTLFPPEYVQEFQSCFDRAPAVPFEDIQRVLREELGRPIDSVYEYVDPTPIASASIAQVHGAKLRGSQEDVVIKVLKPGIEDILVADLNFVYIVARILEFLNPELGRASLVGIVKDIRESMLEEVDFNKEAANIEAFRRYLEAMGLTRQATAPKVYHQCSTRRVLTMQRLYGVPLTDLDSISSLVSSPETSLVTALNVWFGSLLACETFHADVHAGNLWLLRDGRIGFLDFGIVGRISPKTWAAMEVFLESIATEEYESMASALIEMGATNKDDLDTEIIVATTRGPSTNTTAVAANVVVDERQMNALFLDVVRVSESYGLRFPREFALLMKQLLYFDRYTRLLAPNLNMLQDQRITIVSNRGGRNRDTFK
ncbi:putative aarF domain-containing protein kinase, chloroplastic [Vitis vinifera]|uniref:Putative aarF domain-containing protein kinase, chloroplastic n=1 Tax=Vitis vinifera TaxID=29760 RepID=A0A438J2E5_VITVI|nr:putative aarF domain-containing protein kinase, chloroplastic [Vitis vinifera]